MELRHQALQALLLRDPAAKADAARALHAARELSLDTAFVFERPPGVPGRPDRPQLVPTLQVPKRSPFTTEGRAALLHAIAHIEFNAIKTLLYVSKIVIHEDSDLVRPLFIEEAGSRQ